MLDLNTSISVSDPDGDTVTLSKVSGPGWLTLSTTGAISGKPSLSDRGRAELVVDASDGALNTTATITIQVNLDAGLPSRGLKGYQGETIAHRHAQVGGLRRFRLSLRPEEMQQQFQLLSLPLVI